MAKTATKLKAVKTQFNGTVTIKKTVPVEETPNITIRRYHDDYNEVEEVMLEDNDGNEFYIPTKNLSEVIKGLEKFL